MADWFETRFREPVDAGQLDPAYAARVRVLVVEEWQADAGSTPSHHPDADDHEGDIIMLETEDRPTGDLPASPRRRSPGRWLLVAAAVAVVAIVGGLLAADNDDELDTVTSVPEAQPPQDIMDVPESDGTLEPGAYFIDPDGDPSTPLRVTYQIAADGWEHWIGAMKSDDAGHVGLSITTVTNLVRDACLDQRPADPAVGPTVDDLATALTQLAPFAVSSPPSDVTIGGYPGKHLQLTVPQLAVTSPGPLPNAEKRFTDCQDGGILHSWISPLLGGSFWGYAVEPGRTEDFWILDVDGTRLVLETNEGPDSPAQDVAELEAIFDSIRIEP